MSQWRDEAALARRMDEVRGWVGPKQFEARRFAWVTDHDVLELRVQFANDPELYAWLYQVAGKTLSPEKREAIENFAKARYGL